MVDENASPADTLKAYNKAVDVREKILAGMTLVNWQHNTQKNPSAKDNMAT